MTRMWLRRVMVILGFVAILAGCGQANLDQSTVDPMKAGGGREKGDLPGPNPGQFSEPAGDQERNMVLDGAGVGLAQGVLRVKLPAEGEPLPAVALLPNEDTDSMIIEVWQKANEPEFLGKESTDWYLPFLRVSCQGTETDKGKIVCNYDVKRESSDTTSWDGFAAVKGGGGVDMDSGPLSIAEFKAQLLVGGKIKWDTSLSGSIWNGAPLELLGNESPDVAWYVHSFLKTAKHYQQAVQQCRKSTPKVYFTSYDAPGPTSTTVCTQLSPHKYTEYTLSYRQIQALPMADPIELAEMREDRWQRLSARKNGIDFGASIVYARSTAREATAELSVEGKVGIVSGQFVAEGGVGDALGVSSVATIGLNAVFEPSNLASPWKQNMSAGYVFGKDGEPVGIFVAPSKEVR